MLRIFLPTDTIQDIKTLDEFFEFGIISSKQYSIRKIKMLHPYFSQEIRQEVSALENQFLQNIKSERQHYNDLVEVLDKIEYLNLSQSNDDIQESHIEEHVFTNDGDITNVETINQSSYSKESNIIPSTQNKLIIHKMNEENATYHENGTLEHQPQPYPTTQTLNAIDINMQCDTTTNMENNNNKFNMNLKSISSENKENNNKLKNDINNKFVGTNNLLTNENNHTMDIIVNKETRSSTSRRTQHKSYIKKTRNFENNQMKITDMFKVKHEVDINEEDNFDILENHATKKIKISDPSPSPPEVNLEDSSNLLIPNRCILCRQILTSKLPVLNEFSDDAIDELTLIKNHLHLSEIIDNKPKYKLTNFSMYDQAGHLCPFDSGLIERGCLIFCTGYIKDYNTHSSDIKDGTLIKGIGPIKDWWLSDDEIILTTSNCMYSLIEAADSYMTFTNILTQKILLTKYVIELLIEYPQLEYEHLVYKLEAKTMPEDVEPINEEALINYSDFVCNQVYHYNRNNTTNFNLILTPCFRHLVKITGTILGVLKNRIQNINLISPNLSDQKDNLHHRHSPIINMTLNTFEIPTDNNQNGIILIDKRCNKCDICKNSICIKCGNKKSSSCYYCKCPNIAIEELDNLDESDYEMDEELNIPMELTSSVGRKKKVVFLDEPYKKVQNISYYKSIQSGKLTFNQSNIVLVKSFIPEKPYIVEILYFFEDNDNKMFHGKLFCRGQDTILGNLSNLNEIFDTNECKSFQCHSIIEEAFIKKKDPLQTSEISNILILQSKRYNKESGRFEDICSQSIDDTKSCPYCIDEDPQPHLEDLLDKNSDKKKHYSAVLYKGVRYTVGSHCYITPDVFDLNSYGSKSRKQRTSKHDTEMYPEFYRKTINQNEINHHHQIPNPFVIGHILSIEISSAKNLTPSPKNIQIRILKLFRSEETNKGIELSSQKDLNCLYWSEKEYVVTLSKLRGICYVTYSENIPEDPSTPLSDWFNGGPDRFYFTQAYNPDNRTILEPPNNATLIGRPPAFKRKGGGKVKSALRKRISNQNSNTNETPVWKTNSQKLRTMDIFCGCGGLSEGLNLSGLTETKWVIDPDSSAVNTFKMNHPHCTVYNKKCNILLDQLLKENDEIGNHNNNNNINDEDDDLIRLPKVGEVDLICGSPPLQEFNDKSPFNLEDYGNFKNSSLCSYLSFCDFYRPKYLIIENVDKFVNFKYGMILKWTIRCLINMGYQCSFGIIPDGDFGIPSYVKRIFIIGAAPGETLPQMPEPIHAFSPNINYLEIKIDNKKYIYPRKWSDSAPLRYISIRDAISDLPPIVNGQNDNEIVYCNDPDTHIQRLLRCLPSQLNLYDHICKQMSFLVETRMNHIPTASGADWRDLPNIEVQLANGQMTQKLKYLYFDNGLDTSPKKKLRGLCCCSEGKICEPHDRQFNTLIPWNLSHTGKHNHHWHGLYGRLEWDGLIEDPFTVPEPMSKYGRVLHPSQPRVISVREYARIKGFADTYIFSGSIYDKYIQIGNSVPPPVGVAIGYEILKCIHKK